MFLAWFLDSKLCGSTLKAKIYFPGKIVLSAGKRWINF